VLGKCFQLSLLLPHLTNSSSNSRFYGDIGHFALSLCPDMTREMIGQVESSLESALSPRQHVPNIQISGNARVLLGNSEPVVGDGQLSVSYSRVGTPRHLRRQEHTKHQTPFAPSNFLSYLFLLIGVHFQYHCHRSVLRPSSRTAMRPDVSRDPMTGPDSGPQEPFPIKLSGPVVRGFGRGSKEVRPYLHLAL